MPNFSYFGRLVWSGPWGWLKSNLHLIIGGNLYILQGHGSGRKNTYLIVYVSRNEASLEVGVFIRPPVGRPIGP